MADKTTSRMKEARLLLTRIPKLLAPFLLFAVTGFLHNGVKYVYTNPLTAEMSRHLSAMEDHTDHSSAEYARHMEEVQQVARELLGISIAVALVTLTLAFAKQIVACCFAASSTTNSGDRYSLADLLREVTRWQNMKIPLITTAAVVTVWHLLFVALLGANFPTAMRDLGLLSESEQGSLVLVAFLAFLYLGVLALMSVGIAKKERSVLVLTTLLLPTLLIPVCALGLLHLYTKQVMGLGMSLLSIYDLLQGVEGLLYLSAASVYCYCYPSKAMKESKEMVVAKSQYFTYAIIFVVTLILWAAIYYITSKMLA